MSQPMSEVDVLHLCGLITGMLLRASVEDLRVAATNPLLEPKYRRNIEALAKLRELLGVTLYGESDPEPTKDA